MEQVDSPVLLVLAGPNGAGQSTVAPTFIQNSGVAEFVNADEIAKGISAFHPESVALLAGQMALDRMRQLSQSRKSFAIETTLAARTDVGMIKKLRDDGDRVHLMFAWLPNSELAIRRVADRVRAGGHHIEEGMVRRRYQAGLDNLFELYIPIVNEWIVCDGSSVKGARIVASGCFDEAQVIYEPSLWEAVKHGVSKQFRLREPLINGADSA